MTIGRVTPLDFNTPIVDKTGRPSPQFIRLWLQSVQNFNATTVLDIIGGDGTLDTTTGILTVSKTHGVPFAASATVDTTNASNISSGTLNSARLPASGAAVGSYQSPDLTVDVTGRITTVTAAPFYHVAGAPGTTTATPFGIGSLYLNTTTFGLYQNLVAYIVGGTAPVVAASNHSTQATGPASTSTVTLTTTASSSLLVLVAEIGDASSGASSVSTVTDSHGLTWARRAHISTSNQCTETWWAHSTAAQAYTITVTLAGTMRDWVLTALEVTGADVLAPWDTNVSLPAVPAMVGGTGPCPTATFSTDNAHCLVLGLGYANNASNTSNPQITAPAGYTQDTSAAIVNIYCESGLVSHKDSGASPLSGATFLPVVANANSGSYGTMVDALLPVVTPAVWDRFVTTSMVSGDITMSSSGVATLAATGVTAGTYGNSTNVAQITIDAKGRITAATNVAVSGGGGSGGSMLPLVTGDLPGPIAIADGNGQFIGVLL